MKLKAGFRVFYLDDGTIGGDLDTLMEDVSMFEEEAKKLGLCLNHQKSELIRCPEVSVIPPPSSFKDMRLVRSTDATFLGSPIGDTSSINMVLQEKIEFLKTMSVRLSLLARQDALLLLRHAFALPKVLCILRTAPCFLSPLLHQFDLILRSTLSTVLNADLSSDAVWEQASLPVRAGGIGIRMTAELAPSAFLSSAAGCQDLITCLLPLYSPPAALESAIQLWSRDHDHPPPQGVDRMKQKEWDAVRVQCIQRKLISSTPVNSQSRARLLAAFTKESGYWLDAPPISSLGLRMEDEVIRIAVGLRIGVPLVVPHSCQHALQDICG